MLGAAQAALLGAASAAKETGSYTISRWNFDATGTYTDAEDVSNAAAIGAPQPGADPVASDGGKSIQLAGLADGAYAADDAAYHVTEFSVVVWFQVRSVPTAGVNESIVNKTVAGAIGGFNLELINNDGNAWLGAYGRDANGTAVRVGAAKGIQQLSLDTGYRAAMTFSVANGMRVYLASASTNHGLIASNSTGGIVGLTSNSEPIYFFCYRGATGWMDGLGDRVEFYAGELAAATIAALAAPQNASYLGGGGGTYTPFPFVTTDNPPLSHAGCTARPSYSATTPLNAVFTDPMSGLPVFRLGGNRGDTVYINGTSNSGLVYPQRLINENSPLTCKVWNADGTLLMIDRRFSTVSSGDPGNSVSSYIVDVDASHGASKPFLILRASSSDGLGDGVSNQWIWHPTDPLKALVVRDNGALDWWWPIGGDGHSTGQIVSLRGPLTGYGSVFGVPRHQLHMSADGHYFVMGCKETSGSLRWGGIRIDLTTGNVAGPFMPSLVTFSGSDGNTATRGTSWTGTYTFFSPDGARSIMVNAATGAQVSDTNNVDFEWCFPPALGNRQRRRVPDGRPRDLDRFPRLEHRSWDIQSVGDIPSQQPAAHGWRALPGPVSDVSGHGQRRDQRFALRDVVSQRLRQRPPEGYPRRASRAE